MSEISDRYETIADGFTARVAGIPPDRWTASSPCSEWQARDVVTHVIDVHHRVLAGLEGSPASEVRAEDELPPLWTTATAAVRDALHDPDRAARVISGGPFGEQPFESLVGRLRAGCSARTRSSTRGTSPAPPARTSGSTRRAWRKPPRSWGRSTTPSVAPEGSRRRSSRSPTRTPRRGS